MPRQPPPSKVRGARPADAPPPSRGVAIPTPDELGIAAARRGVVRDEADWADARRQMQRLGVVRFQMEQLAGERARLSCWLRDGAGTRLVQGEGRTEGEAVRTCLDKARRGAAN